MLNASSRSLVFLSVGITLMVSSALARHLEYTWLENILINFGVVSIAVVIVDFLWRCSGGNPTDHEIQRLQNQIERLSKTVDVIEGSKSVGLDSVHDRVGDFGNQSDWISLLKDSMQTVDLMGRTMYNWIQCPELEEVILTAIKERNVKFRWLIMAEDNKYLPMLIENGVEIDSMLKTKIKNVAQALNNIREKLPENKKKNLELRTFKNVPLYGSLVRVDDKYYSSPYLCSTASNNSPLFSITGSYKSWPKTYEAEFTSVWNSSKNI